MPQRENMAIGSTERKKSGILMKKRSKLTAYG